NLPIVTKYNIPDEKINEFNSFIEYLEKNIVIPILEPDISGISVIDYNKIEIKDDLNNKTNISYFKEDNSLIKEEILLNEKLFLIAKNNNDKKLSLSIISEDELTDFILEGILYVEGDLIIDGNINFNGIIIINKGELH